MQLNPFLWLLIVAPAAVLGVLVFLFVYGDQKATLEVQREQHQIEALEFDRDFSKAWNGESITGPAQAEIDQAKAHLVERKRLAEEERRQNCERLASLASDLQSTVQPTTQTPVTCN